MARERCPHGKLKRYGDYVNELMFCEKNNMHLCIYSRTCAQCSSSIMLNGWEKCYEKYKDK